MPTIKINQTIEYDFEDYTYGNTFEITALDFYLDDKFLMPQVITGWSFIMDIKGDEECCNFERNQPPVETLGIGTGITLDPVITNRIKISKVLTSFPGMYKQSITSTDTAGKVTTFERGTLKIDHKI